METQKQTKTLEEIVAELDRKTLNNLVCRHADNDEDFHGMILKAAMSKNDVYEDIKNEIASIKRSKRFYDWRTRGELYSKLGNILEAIELNVTDSEQGIDLTRRFLLLDTSIRCDDSDGGLGDIFNYNAVELLKKFAPTYVDKEKLEQIVYKLIEINDCGCHDGVLEEIGEILPEKNIRSLMTKDFSRDRNYIKPKMAFALKDAPLFEKLLAETRPNGFGNCDLTELAECWIACGDLGKALEYALKIDPNLNYSYKKDGILEEIYTKNGDMKALKELYSKSFISNPFDETKEKIIKNFGIDFFNKLLEQRIEKVENSEQFYQDEVVFLLQYKDAAAAEKYLLARKNELDGVYFHSDFIKLVKKEFSPLAQTIVLRVPLNYYLESANTKYYPTAAKHLKYLAEIAPLVTDWQDVQPHSEFMEVINAKHYRKKSFWKYFE